MTSDGSIVADRITTGVMNADLIRGGHLSIATSIDKNAPWTTIEPNYISFRNGPNAGTEIGYIVPQVLASSHAGTQRGLVYNSYLYIFECDELWVGNQEAISGDNDHKSVCALGAKGDSDCYDQTLGIYKMQVGGKNIYIRRGFIVNEENAEKFLEGKLDILGLNEKEKTDFITFWLPILLRNKLSLCTFQTQKFFNNYELNINPKPDSMIRVFLTIKKLERPINIREQKLELVVRKGFSVVEWGGSNI
jgi:hypothetical protein